VRFRTLHRFLTAQITLWQWLIGYNMSVTVSSMFESFEFEVNGWVWPFVLRLDQIDGEIFNEILKILDSEAWNRGVQWEMSEKENRKFENLCENQEQTPCSMHPFSLLNDYSTPSRYSDIDDSFCRRRHILIVQKRLEVDACNILKVVCSCNWLPLRMKL
jgi:hypothetical protein